MSDEIHKVSEVGHYSLDFDDGYKSKTERQAEFNQNLSHKMRLKVLQGRFAPNSKDKAMILKYRESGKTPEEFLKTWKV
jgi:hypothetical protein